MTFHLFLPGQLAHTYSIVARDPATGEMGVAVQSHWFSVGPIVPWVEAGIGAIATQSLVNVSYGPKGLQLLKQGKSASEVVAQLTQTDDGRDVRQLAVVDAQGRAAAHTGQRCIAEAGHQTGDNFSVQANMMLNDKVWPAMAHTFAQNDGPLAERMVAALEAAQAEGGDIRGKQSAALVVVRGEATGKVWEDRLIDLRVEDHPEPVQELKRLLHVFRAYEHMNAGDEALEKNDVPGALQAYSTAEAMLPDNMEMKFWHAVSLVNSGMTEESLPIFKDVFAQDKNWATLLQRLPQADLLQAGTADVEKVLAQQ
jgi:uncharacterized Ntn-hydrolase superfamily protein